MMTNVKDSVEDLHPRTWLRGKARADGTGDAAVGEDAQLSQDGRGSRRPPRGGGWGAADAETRGHETGGAEVADGGGAPEKKQGSPFKVVRACDVCVRTHACARGCVCACTRARLRTCLPSASVPACLPACKHACLRLMLAFLPIPVCLCLSLCILVCICKRLCVHVCA